MYLCKNIPYLYINFVSFKNKQEHKKVETIKEIYEQFKEKYVTAGELHIHDILPAMAYS